MRGFVFRTGSIFEWNGADHRIIHLGVDGQVVLEQLDNGLTVLSSQQALLAAFGTGEIRWETGVKSSMPQAYQRPLGDLPLQAQEHVRRRKAYLDAIIKAGRPSLSSNYLTPLISKVSAQINDANPPSPSSVYRWYKAYIISQDARALIPRFDNRGRPGIRGRESVPELFREAVEEAFRASPSANVTTIFTRLAGKIYAANAQRLSDEQLDVPTLRTVYRWFSKLEAYDQTRLAKGKTVADRQYRVTKAGPVVSGILMRVEVDHTPLDLFLIDEITQLPLGRPTLTMYLDVYSRFPLGYYLSFGGTSASAVVGGLRHAILPKSPVKEVVPDLPIQHKWPCYGLISLLVADNGLEFYSSALDSVAMDLGMSIHYCPKRQPWFKGAIERHLQTFNFTLSHQLPGTSLARLEHRGDYDSQKHALLTLAEFKHILEQWLLDIYAQQKHRGIGTTPWAKWHEGLKDHTPALPNSLDELQRRIGLVEERTLRHDGILLKGIRYASPNLEPILRAWGSGVKLRLVFDPEDLGSIQVWAPEQPDPVKVPALNQEYAKGLTLLQHELIQQQVRENGHNAENAQALAQAKYDLALAVDELLNSRKQRGRRRAANIHGKTSTHPEARLTPGAPPKPVIKPVPPPVDQTDILPEMLPTFTLSKGGQR